MRNAPTQLGAEAWIPGCGRWTARPEGDSKLTCAGRPLGAAHALTTPNDPRRPDCQPVPAS